MFLNETLNSGSITTQNLNPASGTATTGSTVQIDTRSDSTCTVQVTGTYTGALTPQATVDGTNWIALSATGLLNINTGAYSSTIASAATGIYQVDVSGFQYFRISANAAVTGTAVATLRSNATDSMVALDNPLPAGGNLIGSVTNTPTTATLHNLTAAGTTNATSVKATTGSIYALTLSNYSAGVKYVKLYNKATAPTVGTDIPLDTIPVAANSYLPIEFGAIGLRFTTGIAYALTGAQADTDTTALTAGDIKVHMSYV